MLPQFVRDRLTIAIAEPFYGGSYGGDPAEACGECWEIDTLDSTQVFMVDNLCPDNDANSRWCANPNQLHFDLSQEAGTAVGSTVGEFTARPVPCPVTGNVHVFVRDRNEFGFVRMAFVNHRYPIRNVEFQAASGGAWEAMERSGGVWAVTADPFTSGGEGARFRLTSANGETVEGTTVFPYSVANEGTFDVGAQFSEQPPEGGACVYVPRGDVYDEGWGGVENLEWQSLTWGSATIEETDSDCADGPSCLRVNLPQFNGARAFQINDFHGDTFQSLQLQVRTVSGTGEVTVNVDADGGMNCESQVVAVSETWQQVTLDLPGGCAGRTDLSALSLVAGSDGVELLVDEVFFMP